MKTFKFKLYRHKRLKQLQWTINAASSIYNHCIALHKKYYALFGKHLSKYQLQKHIAKKRRSNPYWQRVGSQAVQDITERIDRAYKLFFKHHSKGVRPPNFKKRVRYKSFTLKQAGYKFLGDGTVRIGQAIYRYFDSRPIIGTIKTLTVKRDEIGDIYLFVVTDAEDECQQPLTGKSVGLDFGVKSFLTLSDGTTIKSPLFFKRGVNAIRKANRNLSRKKKGSNSREKARLALARLHRKIKNQRTDWFWELAHQLTDQYDHLFFETLNLKGMARLWGRKIHDLAFGEFLSILGHVCFKKGKSDHYIDRWFPSSKTCNGCNHVLDELPLNVRQWRCPHCGQLNDRDENAAKNILREGMTSLALDTVSQASPASVA